ncbi:hypothetical protein [Methylobacterium sp. JK268]
MTAISAASQQYSPQQRLLDQLSRQEQSGAISATDGQALSAAIDDIGTSLGQGSSTGSSARLDPSQAKSRIDDLIAGEVDKGTLTSAQADELKSLFAKGPHGGGHPHGVGGDPDQDGGGIDPAAGTDGTASTASTSASGTGATSTSDLLSSFIKQLQDAQAQTQSSTYGQSGTTGSSSVSAALLIDFQA